MGVDLASHREGHSTDWGFKARDLTLSLIEQLGLSEDTRGVLVEDVDPEGPAARAGMRRGDVILEVNKQELDDVSDLERALDSSDDSLVLLLQRGDSTLYLALDRE